MCAVSSTERIANIDVAELRQGGAEGSNLSLGWLEFGTILAHALAFFLGVEPNIAALNLFVSVIHSFILLRRTYLYDRTGNDM